MAGLAEGIALIVFAALFQSLYALFLKFRRHWEWENFWAVFSVTALVILPAVLSVVFVPNVLAVLSASPRSAIVYPLVMGMLWGVGSVIFGLSVLRIGVALTYSLIIGSTATLGSLLPLLLSSQLPGLKAIMVFSAGIIIMIIGLIVSAIAGMKRELQRKGSGFKLGLILAGISGITSAMLNVGFVLGGPIVETAHRFGVPEELSTLPVWIVVLFGGFLVNFGYATYLLFEDRTFTLFFKETQVPGLLSVISAIFFFSGLAIYGIASSLLETLGTSVGWAILMSLMIVISNLSGIITGEWKGSDKPLRYQLASILILVIGIATLGISLYL